MRGLNLVRNKEDTHPDESGNDPKDYEGMMDKKRPIGVTILGLLVIFANTLMLFPDFLYTKLLKVEYWIGSVAINGNFSLGMFDIFFYEFWSVIVILCCIGLLFLSNIVRIIFLIFCWLEFIPRFIYFVFPIMKNGRLLEEGESLLLFFHGLFPLIIPLVCIIYLTRHKVKRQFK